MTKKCLYKPQLDQYAGGVTSAELIDILRQQHTAGKKIFVVIGRNVNELTGARVALAPASSGPFILEFKSSKSSKKVVL